MGLRVEENFLSRFVSDARGELLVIVHLASFAHSSRGVIDEKNFNCQPKVTPDVKQIPAANN